MGKYSLMDSATNDDILRKLSNWNKTIPKFILFVESFERVIDATFGDRVK